LLGEQLEPAAHLGEQQELVLHAQLRRMTDADRVSCGGTYSAAVNTARS